MAGLFLWNWIKSLSAFQIALVCGLGVFSLVVGIWVIAWYSAARVPSGASARHRRQGEGARDQNEVDDSARVELLDARLPPEELALELRQNTQGPAPGITVWLRNTGLKPLRQCSLTIRRLQTFSAAHGVFREPDFQELVVLVPRDLAPEGAPQGKSQSDAAGLARINDHRRTEVAVAVGHRFQGVRETKPRWWRADLLVKADSRVRLAEAFFRWKPGGIPEFAGDPRKEAPGEADAYE